MLDEYKAKLAEAKKNKKSIRKKIDRLRKLRKGAVDSLVHPLHEAAFENIDCLNCANCCKTTGPLFTRADIERIANYLHISAADFTRNYLKVDEDNDYVLKSTPCSFLGSDNYCSIYEVRPKACREYPHTDRSNQLGILNLTEKNADICPAVADIFRNLEL